MNSPKMYYCNKRTSTKVQFERENGAEGIITRHALIVYTTHAILELNISMLSQKYKDYTFFQVALKIIFFFN
jgi:hypothetical protein